MNALKSRARSRRALLSLLPLAAAASECVVDAPNQAGSDW
jgi:hypothetical protein